MNKHEFRIGNKILLGSEVCTLSELFEDEFKTPEHGFGDYSHPQLSGIPLTEEWLLKFGFERMDKKDSAPFYHITTESSKGRFLVFNLGRCLNGSYSPLSYGDIHEEIIFVHQLQNLFYAITGKELVASI